MKPFIEFIRGLILRKYHGWIHIHFNGEYGIIEVKREDSEYVKPFQQGWKEPIPD